MSSYWSEVVTVLAWTKQNTMQRAMRTVLEWPQSHANIIHIMITNKYEPQLKHRLGTVSKKLLGGLNRFYGIPTSPSASIMAQNTVVRSVWRFSNSSMDHHEKQINHRWILWWSKDEDSTGTCCDRHLEIPGVSNNTTGTLEQKITNSWTSVGQATDKKAPAQPN